MPSYKIFGSKWSWAQVQTSPNLRGTWIHTPTLGLGSASKSSSHNLLGKYRPMNCPLHYWGAVKAACCWTHLLCLPCTASKGVEVTPFFNPGMLIAAFGLRRTYPSLIWCSNFRIFLLPLAFHWLGQWTEPPGRQKPSPRTMRSLGAAQGPGRAGALAGKALDVLLHYPALGLAQQCLCQPGCATTEPQQSLGSLAPACHGLGSGSAIKYGQETTCTGSDKSTWKGDCN